MTHAGTIELLVCSWNIHDDFLHAVYHLGSWFNIDKESRLILRRWINSPSCTKTTKTNFAKNKLQTSSLKMLYWSILLIKKWRSSYQYGHINVLKLPRLQLKRMNYKWSQNAGQSYSWRIEDNDFEISPFTYLSDKVHLVILVIGY